MAKIALLPNSLIDQIAAGEVLENPASAVKELVENALDAGATEISVAIEGGGLQRLEVEDDGCGMDAEDLALCLLRHATSKIRTQEDLLRIGTKGFRGEALAAINAVSKLEVRTSTGAGGARLMDGSIGPCARRRGTSIEVRALFQNTPARLKFQKSPAACAAAVLKTVETISLAHPEVRFRLVSNGKEVLKLAPKTWKERAEEVIGPLNYELSGMRGLVGRPEDAKGNRSGQWLFVNGRPVISGLIGKAVKDGFGTRMEERLFPAFLLFLEIPPDEVDVNVHPQKREVRFLDERRVFEMVRSRVAAVFEQKTLAPMPWDFSPLISPMPLFAAAEESVAKPLMFAMESPFRLIGLMDDLMLIEENGWVLVDLRGALARVLFEGAEAKNVVGEPLLIPFKIEVPDPELVAADIAQLGIEARPLSKRELGVFSLPAGMEMGDVERLVMGGRDLAAALTRSLKASKRSFQAEEARLIWQRLQKCKDRTYDPLGKKIAVQLTKEELRRFF